MTDNAPVPEGTSQPSAPPTSGTAPQPSPAKPPPAPVRKNSGGKVVVMLSSVAKPPPAGTQLLARTASPADSSPRPIPAPVGRLVRPPPLPVKTSSPVRALPLPVQIKEANAPLKVEMAPVSKAQPPPLPTRMHKPIPSEPKKSGAKPIRLNQASPRSGSIEESIFASDEPEASNESTPKGWKHLEPGELDPLPDDLQSLDVFARSQRPAEPGEAKPSPSSSLKAPEDQEPSSRAPAMKTRDPVRPPPLPLAKPAESSAPHSSRHAPPLLEKSPGLPADKLPAPHLPVEAPPAVVLKSSATSEPPGVHKAPAIILRESVPGANRPPALPSKVIGPITLREQPAPVEPAPPPMVIQTKAVTAPSTKVDETKPAARPPPLPNKVIILPWPSGTATAPATVNPALEPAQKPVGPISSVKSPAPIPAYSAAKAPLPLSRVERARRRRLMETAGFYAAFAATVVVLVAGAFYFGRQTEVEGQLIPPAGMSLGNEAWIVGDFRELSSGIAEDLAAERMPLKQEIQERLDHVERVQADIASREERIRLLKQQIDSSRDMIVTLIKQARDATQQLWDGPGADLDAEYTTRLDQLQKAIEDRAKSLNLNYQPDPTYPSPEVWANAFRLALYDVPATVDSTKEHQWLGDQMKQWRDFLKSLDDRKEQLREQAAQLKLSPGGKIADLDTKMDDLQHHIDSTLAEEEPLKAELQQAQTDLTQVQATEAGLDDKYYKQLYTLPEGSITDRMAVAANGRFTWPDVDKSKPFAEGETEHFYWIFARATRSDGRQYWALHRFAISKDETLEMVIEPGGFISTKAILRPELSADEQEQ